MDDGKARSNHRKEEIVVVMAENQAVDFLPLHLMNVNHPKMIFLMNFFRKIMKMLN
jgi:hypothetical protein